MSSSFSSPSSIALLVEIFCCGLMETEGPRPLSNDDVWYNFSDTTLGWLIRLDIEMLQMQTDNLMKALQEVLTGPRKIFHRFHSKDKYFDTAFFTNWRNTICTVDRWQLTLFWALFNISFIFWSGASESRERPAFCDYADELFHSPGH